MKTNVKNILFRRNKLYLFVATIFIFLIWLILRYLLKPSFLFPYLESIFYWIELILILEIVWIFKIESKMILYFSLLLIAAGGVLDVFGFGNSSEAALRASFAPLLVGAVLNLKELKQKK